MVGPNSHFAENQSKQLFHEETPGSKHFKEKAGKQASQRPRETWAGDDPRQVPGHDGKQISENLQPRQEKESVKLRCHRHLEKFTSLRLWCSEQRKGGEGNFRVHFMASKILIMTTAVLFGALASKKCPNILAVYSLVNGIKKEKSICEN